ncbi:Transcriptional regulator OS=Streptomyces microflavus OX=1919 GN=Smic_05590 PE=4 SV=1 [Streptomyces microflavus]
MGDLDAGLESIQATPPRRVLGELAILDRTVGAPAWAGQLAGQAARTEFAGILRAYHDAVIAPHEEEVQARVEAERAVRCRGRLDGGTDGMLAGLGPMLRWRPPVLEVAYPRQADDRDLHLNGRGAHARPLVLQLGRTGRLRRSAAAARALVLAAPRAGPAGQPAPRRRPRPVPGQPARAGPRGRAARRRHRGHDRRDRPGGTGVSASSASRHATALRDAGLVTTVRTGPSVLHTLTPAGASLLRAGARARD